MKNILFALAVMATAPFARAEVRVADCMPAAEDAAYRKWVTSNSGRFGHVMANGTDVVWIRGNTISYQVSIMSRKPDSSNIDHSHYSVRVRDTGRDCRVVKVRKF